MPINSAKSCISQDVLSRLRTAATQPWMRHNGQLLDCSASHGELIPQNILVNGDHIGIVDFDTYETRATVYKDPSRFLAYLALLSSKKRYSNAAILALAHGFLSIYEPKLEPSLLSAHVLNAMLSIATHPQSEPVLSSARKEVERAILGVLDVGFPPAPKEGRSV
jgi:tRNA A-37 threonylcarbamoyl transferase component Bud32